MHELTDDLMAMVRLAAAHAVDSLRGDGALVPFVLSETPAGARRLQRPADVVEFDSDSGLESVREAARQSAAEDAIVALAYRPPPSAAGEGRGAICVEAAEHGGPAFVFLQGYGPRRGLRGVRTLGPIALVGEGAPFAGMT